MRVFLVFLWFYSNYIIGFYIGFGSWGNFFFREFCRGRFLEMGGLLFKLVSGVFVLVCLVFCGRIYFFLFFWSVLVCYYFGGRVAFLCECFRDVGVIAGREVVALGIGIFVYFLFFWVGWYFSCCYYDFLI